MEHDLWQNFLFQMYRINSKLAHKIHDMKNKFNFGKQTWCPSLGLESHLELWWFSQFSTLLWRSSVMTLDTWLQKKVLQLRWKNSQVPLLQHIIFMPPYISYFHIINIPLFICYDYYYLRIQIWNTNYLILNKTRKKIHKKIGDQKRSYFLWVLMNWYAKSVWFLSIFSIAPNIKITRISMGLFSIIIEWGDCDDWNAFLVIEF